MKKLSFLFPFLFLLPGIFSACTSDKTEQDIEADIIAVRAVLDRYKHAAEIDDIDLFMTCWADDAKRLEPDLEFIQGKENIRAHFLQIWEPFTFSIKFYGETDIGVSGDLAYMQVNSILTATPKGGGPAMNMDAKVVDVLKRQADGSWKIIIDSFSPNPKWTNESVSPDMMENPDPSTPVL